MKDLLEFQIIDRIIAEPIGGAQRAPNDAIVAVADVIEVLLNEFDGMDGQQIKEARSQKFLDIGSHLSL